jgi:hypothetical protein
MDIATGIRSTANQLGISPIDLATAISYETGGTFNPLELGPETKYGQHRGLIQFGEPQANQYGVSFETRPQAISTQLGPGAGIYQYLKAVGVKPGMGLEQIYSAINTGGVNNLNMTDERAGGMPGTVAEKVASMGDHKKNAEKFMELVMQNQPLNTSPLLDPQNNQAPVNQQPTGMDKNPLFSMLGKTVGGGFSKLKDAVTGKDPDASDRLSIALMSLSGNPGQLQPMIAMAAQDIKDRKTQRINNKSLEYIRQVDPELAKLVENDPRLMQQVLSQAMAKQLKGKKTIMSAAEILEQFGQTVPDGSYEVTVGKDNQATDISPINPRLTTDPKDLERFKAALKTSTRDAGNFRDAVTNLSRFEMLETYLDGTDTGFVPGLKQFMFEKFNIDRRDQFAAAAAALINQIVPAMRPKGSGPMSDRDLEMFKASAPSIAALPGGNALIVKTLKGLAQYERDFAEIHQKFLDDIEGFNTPQLRNAAIDALEDPMKEAKAFMVSNQLAKADESTITREEASEELK